MTTWPAGDFRHPSLREHFVYRLYDADGRLLYVGCTKRLKKRWDEHRMFNRGWVEHVAQWRITGPFNYDDARQIERDALRDEYPLHNHTPQVISAKKRREVWIKHRLPDLLDADSSTDDHMAAYYLLKEESERIDWFAIADEAIRSQQREASA